MHISAYNSSVPMQPSPELTPEQLIRLQEAASSFARAMGHLPGAFEEASRSLNSVFQAFQEGCGPIRGENGRKRAVSVPRLALSELGTGMVQ